MVSKLYFHYDASFAILFDCKLQEYHLFLLLSYARIRNNDLKCVGSFYDSMLQQIVLGLFRLKRKVSVRNLKLYGWTGIRVGGGWVYNCPHGMWLLGNRQNQTASKAQMIEQSAF